MKQRVTEPVVNAKRIDNATTKERTRQMNAEELLVLKKIREPAKNVDWKKTMRKVELVTSVIANIETNSESEDNKLLGSAAFLVAEMLGVKTREKSKKSIKETYWKGRTENNVKTWGKHLSKLDDVRNGNHVLCEKDEKRDDS